jgi:class 3 adenylate cyclase
MGVDAPETRYAKSGDVSIAYQVVGDGPFDLVMIPPFVTNVELAWEDEWIGGSLRRFASFSRLIRFDKRGTGLSDRVEGAPPLETRMDDVRAVMDAVGSRRAAIIGADEGGAMSLLFAATYPDRVFALGLVSATPRYAWAPDFPWGETPEETERELADLSRSWGSQERVQRVRPGWSADRARQFARIQRLSASPGAAVALHQMNVQIDVRPVLTAIRVPTLVIHRKEESLSIEIARWMASRIPTARLVELPGREHHAWAGVDRERVIDELERFLIECWQNDEEEEPDRVLATVLFTDIVGSTAKAAELGDTRWRELLQEHHTRVRRQLVRFRGRELDTAGDGFFASFDGPARAVRCACAIGEAVHDLGLEVRAGLHTGECELLDEKVAGIAVSIGARVAAQAAPGEVLVSSTVKDLVAGSGLEFEERGAAELKGVPGEWQLYAVRS